MRKTRINLGQRGDGRDPYGHARHGDGWHSILKPALFAAFPPYLLVMTAAREKPNAGV